MIDIVGKEFSENSTLAARKQEVTTAIIQELFSADSTMAQDKERFSLTPEVQELYGSIAIEAAPGATAEQTERDKANEVTAKMHKSFHDYLQNNPPPEKSKELVANLGNALITGDLKGVQMLLNSPLIAPNKNGDTALQSHEIYSYLTAALGVTICDFVEGGKRGIEIVMRDGQRAPASDAFRYTQTLQILPSKIVAQEHKAGGFQGVDESKEVPEAELIKLLRKSIQLRLIN